MTIRTVATAMRPTARVRRDRWGMSVSGKVYERVRFPPIAQAPCSRSSVDSWSRSRDDCYVHGECRARRRTRGVRGRLRPTCRYVRQVAVSGIKQLVDVASLPENAELAAG